MNWKWGTAFGIMVLITVLSIVYAFVQQTIARQSRLEAEHQLSTRMETISQLKEKEQMLVKSNAELAFALEKLDELTKKCK